MDSTAEWFECVWENEHHAESTIQNFLEHNMEQVASLLRQSKAPSNVTTSISSELGTQSATAQIAESQPAGSEPMLSEQVSEEPTEQEMTETLSELLALQESLNSLLARHEEAKASERTDLESKELLRRKAEQKETVG